MNDYEKLLAEFENEINFVFDHNLPDKLPAVLIGDVIYVNDRLPFNQAISYLVEEIGHHKTLPEGTNIIDYSKLYNIKLENKGREWGYRKLIPYEKLKKFINQKDSVTVYELAETFNVTESFVEETIKLYQRKENML